MLNSKNNHLENSPTDINRVNGFTLIELLVVVAIICVLIGVLVPSLKGARANSRKVICKSNLRQIYTGSECYASENNQRFPDAWTTGGFGFRVAPGRKTENGALPEVFGLQAVLSSFGFTSDSKVWICPDARDEEIGVYGSSYAFSIASGLTGQYATMDGRRLYGKTEKDSSPWVWDNIGYKPWMSGFRKGSGSSSAYNIDNRYPHSGGKGNLRLMYFDIRLNGSIVENEF